MILPPLVFPGKSDKLTNSNLLQTLVNCGRKKVDGSSPVSTDGQGDRKLQKITENYRKLQKIVSTNFPIIV